MNGQGTKFDPSQAEVWFRRADAAGYEVATFALAWEYRRQKRFLDAEGVLKRAVDKNLPTAAFLMGLIYIDTGKRQEAEKMLKKAAAFGHEVAHSDLKDRCLRGYFGVSAIVYGVGLAISDWKDTRKKPISSKNPIVKKGPEVDPEWG